MFSCGDGGFALRGKNRLVGGSGDVLFGRNKHVQIPERCNDEIKTYVLSKFGLKASSLYISQVKRKCGLEVGDSYNRPKSEGQKVPQCPPEKEKAIMAKLEHFQMI